MIDNGNIKIKYFTFRGTITMKYTYVMESVNP